MNIVWLLLLLSLWGNGLVGGANTKTATFTMSQSESQSWSGSASDSTSQSSSLSSSLSKSLSTSESLTSSVSSSVSISNSFSESISESFSTSHSSSQSESPSDSATISLSFPTATISQTSSLSLPTLTESFSRTLSLPTSTVSRTETFSLTESMSLPTGSNSISFSLSLPTGTETFSLTMSLPTATDSPTFSLTLTKTFSLPTGTATHTISLSLPTATVTHTFTHSLTLTHTLSVSESLSQSLSLTHSISKTETISITLSETLTLKAHDNYTTGLEPYESFTEGMELRAGLTATLQGIEVRHFNLTGGFGKLHTKVWLWLAAYDNNCNSYEGGGGSPYYETKMYGMSHEDQLGANDWVASAFVTFTAPISTSPFIICFKHSTVQIPGNSESINFDFTDNWLLFTRSGFAYYEAAHNYKFQSNPSKIWAFINNPTAGQYLPIQLNSVDETWNFTRPASSCSSSSLATCASGDNLKIVPAGLPCTYEPESFLSDKYYGSLMTNEDGSWSTNIEPNTLNGLLLGTTAGGMGLFGTETEHPLIETSALSSSEVYEPIPQPTSLDSTNSRRRSYSYLRLPRDSKTGYEICFSALELRQKWRLYNETVGNVPMWRKLYLCDTNNCVTMGSSKTTIITFKTSTIGWSMVDLSPGTYGMIRIDSGKGNTGLNRAPVTTKDESASHRNYFNVQGGDQIRIVSSTHFDETFTQRTNPNVFRPLGSAALLGCFYRGNDRAYDEGSDMPSVIRNFHSDPTQHPMTNNDATDVHDLYGSLYIPSDGTWMVCYRPPGTHGWILLPFHYGSHGVPTKWQHIEAFYPPLTTWTQPTDWGPLSLLSRTTQIGIPIIGGYYGTAAQQYSYPAQVQYYANDTRRSTWGPITITNYTTSEVGVMSSMPHNIIRNYSVTSGDKVILTKGSRIRLVPPQYSCDFPFFGDEPDYGSESRDGGAMECNNLQAGISCPGSSLDAIALDEVTYYILFPECTNPNEPSGSTSGSCASPNYCNLCASNTNPICFCLFKVCWQHGGYNWRVVEQQYSQRKLIDSNWDSVTVKHLVAHSVPSVTRSWTLEQSTQVDSSKLLIVDNYPSPTLTWLEDRAGLEATFLISDVKSELSAAPRELCPAGDQYCEASGDVFRLVESSQNCDITPTRWSSGEKNYADTHLSLYCPVSGHGSSTTSGLLQTTPCAADGVTQKEFYASDASSSRRTISLLFTSRTSPVYPAVPPLFDDIVPYDSTYFSTTDVAATLTLPNNPGGSYKQCYKQTGSPNWIIFNETMLITEGTGWTVSPKEVVLLGGELKRFQLSASGKTFEKANNFVAKLVEIKNTDTDGCTNPAGSTEATPFGSVTSSYSLNSGGDLLHFFLVIPHKAGRYTLCLRLEHSSSDNLHWSNQGIYRVVDSGIRWYVTSGNLPTNQGSITIKLIRCVVDNNKWCDPSKATEVFQTGPNMDSAKIVNWDESCHDGTQDGRQSHGSSYHIAKEGGTADGITDLGPADGLATTAEFLATPPRVSSDVESNYKVCVRSFFSAISKTTWIEVPEATKMMSQITNSDPTSGYSYHMRTTAGVANNWVLDNQLRSEFNFSLPEAVVACGSGTKYRSTLGSEVSALKISLYTSLSEASAALLKHRIKLVKKSGFTTRLPPPPYNGNLWVDEHLQADCNSVGYPGTDTQNTGCVDDVAGDGITCPNVALSTTRNEIFIDIQLPSDPGFYILCYQSTGTELSNNQPWLLLHGSLGEEGFWMVPSYLEFDAGTASESSPGQDSISIVDTRSISGVSLSSWCSSDSCSDYIAVVNETMNCPVLPTSFPLIKTSAESTSSSGGFRLPPLVASPTKRYKICVIKGQLSTNNYAQITKPGVAYQMWNRALPDAATLGGSGFFQPSRVGEVDSLLLSISGVEYNDTYQVMVATQDKTPALKGIENTLFGSLLQEITAGVPSHSPVIRSGGYVDIGVQAASNGIAVPFGRYPITVLRCKTAAVWNDLFCSDHSDPIVVPASFEIINAAAVCKNGDKYGWPGGLRQFLSEGKGSVRIQYTSVCPDGTFEVNAGCGIKLAAQITSTLTVYSDPIWINVKRSYPDAIAVDFDSKGTAQWLKSKQFTTALDSSCVEGPPKCYLRRCVSHRGCTISVISLHGGPREFAPLGSLKVLYSILDYQTQDSAHSVLSQSFSDGVRQFIDEDWGTGGSFNMTITPKLKSGVDRGIIFYNISYGDPSQRGWTRIAVEVVRPEATSIKITDVIALDTGPEGISVTNKKEPCPIWHGTHVKNSLTAMTGSYIESLIPYEIRFQVFDNSSKFYLEGSQGTDDLSGWEITAELLNIPKIDNRVMEVQYLPKCSLLSARPCVASHLSKLDPTMNLVTAEESSAALIAAAPLPLERFYPSEVSSPEKSTLWAFRFRIRTNLGCSRISGTAPSGFGCVIRITLLKTGQNTIYTDLITPVRVIGSTIRIKSASTPVDGIVSAGIRDGVQLTLLPGISSGVGSPFMIDEYHTGDIFALVASPLPLNNGIANRDGTRADPPLNGDHLSPVYHSPGRILDSELGTTWGVKIYLKPTLPCNNCEFTFHSTGGLGPDSATTENGLVTVSVFDQTDGVFCTPSQIDIGAIPYSSTDVITSTFTVTVAAGDIAGRLSSGWPRWWVFVNPLTALSKIDSSGPVSSDITLHSTSQSDTSIIAVKMKDSSGAVFSDLYLKRAAVTVTLPGQIDISFATTGIKYSETEIGSIPVGEVPYKCTARFALELKTGVITPRVLTLGGVTGANSLCQNSEGCQYWKGQPGTDISFIAVVNSKTSNGGVGVPLEGYRGNVTVRTEVGEVTWSNCDGTICTTDSLQISPSEIYRDVTAEDEQVYSFGGTPAVFEKDQHPSSPYLKITLKSTTSPVRDSLLYICLTDSSNGVEQIDTSVACLEFHLFISPESSLVNYKTAVISNSLPGGGILHSGSSLCGGTPLSFEIVTYYDLSPSIIKYIAYDIPIEYSITGKVAQEFSGHEHPEVTGVSFIKRTGLLPTTVLERHTHSHSSVVSLVFYGLLESSSTVLSISAQEIDSPSTTIVTTTTTAVYSWRFSYQTFKEFSISVSPDGIDSCTPKVLLRHEVGNYEIYSPSPYFGWDYSTRGGSVGAPIPIQGVVLSGDGGRAYSFPSSYISVQRGDATGCNDGGTLSVYSLKAADSSETVKYDGTLVNSFELLPALGKKTQFGQATLWLHYTEPCEACTISLSLCYTAAVDVNTCLIKGSSPESTPIFAERVKLSKVFRVEYPEETTLVITKQTIPISQSTSSVGEVISINYEAVQQEAMIKSIPKEHQGTVHVWAQNSYSSTVLSAHNLKYGNGGFLLGSIASASCDVSQLDFHKASLSRWDAQGHQSVLSFYFTRPCVNCEVHIKYQIITKRARFAPIVSGTFPIRSEQSGFTSPIKFNVRTCGSIWALGGVPTPAVNRRKHFSLTVLRADGNYVAAFTGDVRTQVLPKIGKRNPTNGGGGELLQTSPLIQAYPPTIKVVGGAGTMRMMFTRACYECQFIISGITISMAVFTNAVQIIAKPKPNTKLSQVMLSSGQKSIFYFDIYAADELGDRSYTIGGPTLLKWSTRYQQGGVNGRSIILNLPNSKSYSLQDSTQATVAVLTSSAAVETLKVENGTELYSGIPFGRMINPTSSIVVDNSPPGVIGISISEPIDQMPLSLTLGTISLPVRGLGTNSPPLITNTVIPDRHFVNTDLSTTHPLTVGEEVSLEVFSVGPIPGAPPEDRTYYIAHDLTELSTATLVIDCSAASVPVCSSCQFSVDGVTSSGGNGTMTIKKLFIKGRVIFKITVLRGSSDPTKAYGCLSSVSSSLSNGSPLTYLMSISERKASSWSWTTTPNLIIIGQPSTSLVSCKASTKRIHTIALTLWDQTFSKQSSYVVGQTVVAESLVINTSPAGCFVPIGVASISLNNNYITWTGYFKSQSSATPPTCTLNTVSGLGVSTSLSQQLVVELFETTTVEIVSTRSMNLTGFTAVTAEGQQSATTANTIFATFNAIQPDGTINEGDWATTIKLTGRRGADTKLISGTVQAGIAKLPIVFSKSTRDSTTGVHIPWVFTADVTYSDEQSIQQTVIRIDNIGPAYVIVRATDIHISLRGHGDTTYTETYAVNRDFGNVEGSLPFQYISGYPMAVKISLTDSFGNTAIHTEDIGHHPIIRFRSEQIPCLSADKLLDVTTQCQVSGRCLLEDTTDCKMTNWKLSSLVDTVLPFAKGVHSITLGELPNPPVRYLGDDVGMVSFLITSRSYDYTRSHSETSWLGRIIMQVPTSIVISDTNCVSGVCQLPPSQFLKVNRSPPLDLTMKGILRIAPLKVFDLTLNIIDSSGRVVSGDNYSKETFTLGTLTGFLNDQFLKGEVKATAVKGRITFTGLGFPFGCAKATLKAIVLPQDTFMDVLGNSNQTITMTTPIFEVKVTTSGNGTTPSPTPVPTSPAVRKFPTAVFKLGSNIDINTFNRSAFESNVLHDVNNKLGNISADRVVLELLCNIPTWRISRKPPISDIDRSNKRICKRYAHATERSVDVLQGNLNSGDSCPCQPLAEFRVEMPQLTSEVSGSVFQVLKEIPADKNSVTATAFDLPADAFAEVATQTVPITAAPTEAPTSVPTNLPIFNSSPTPKPTVETIPPLPQPPSVSSHVAPVLICLFLLPFIVVL